MAWRNSFQQNGLEYSCAHVFGLPVSYSPSNSAEVADPTTALNILPSL